MSHENACLILSRLIVQKEGAGLNKLTIYIPQDKRESEPLERLNKLAKDSNRSLNYLIVQALVEFVDREEQKDPS